MASYRVQPWLTGALVLALMAGAPTIAMEERDDTYMISLHDGIPYMEVYQTDFSDGIGVFLFDQFYHDYRTMQFKKVRFYHEMPAGVPYSVAIVTRFLDDGRYVYEWADPVTYATEGGPIWENVDISHSPELWYYGHYESCYGVFIRFFYYDDWWTDWFPLWVDETIDAPMTSAMIVDLGHPGGFIEPEYVLYNSEGTPYGWTAGEWLMDIEVQCISGTTPAESTTFSILKRLY